jgi:hypothetical protein
VSREYLIALKVKGAIGEAGADVARGLELAAYFTHCNLQPSHLMLALKTAMASAFKNKVRRSYVVCGMSYVVCRLHSFVFVGHSLAFVGIRWVFVDIGRITVS